MADAAYHFLSFVRSGFAASIATPDSFGAGQPAIATASVGVNVSGAPAPVTHAAAVRGPGDVVGLASGSIVRTDPVDGAVGTEPNYFAQVEFDRPDVPWLFTPAAPVGEKLRPWIVLVVVDLDGPNPCTLAAGAPLPQLRVPTGAAAQLPDLRDSHLWAHAQVVTPDGQAVGAALDGDPRLSVSRLLCPRHLEPLRWYLAAVVPAFAVGRLAGLGLPVTETDEARLEPAWTPGAAAVLPVLHSFRFKTGDSADFEALARRIQGRRLPPEVGARPLDVSRPGAGLPSLPAPDTAADARAIEWLEGALAPLDGDAHPPREETARAAMRASLTVLLDRPAALMRGGNADAVVAPPIYGDQHARVVELGAGTPPPWISELNLDPRARIAAGLGTAVMQDRQDDIVARAWEQLGDVLEANRLLRGAQLARSGSAVVHGRLEGLDAATLYGVSAPAHARVAGVAGSRVSAAKDLRDSRLPDVALEPAFRRLARPGGITARTAGAARLGAAVAARFARDEFKAPVGGPDGATTMAPAMQVIGAAGATAVLTALGDTPPASPARLDTLLDTLASHVGPLPRGDELRATTLRTDVGAIGFATGLGALKASAVNAVLGVAGQGAGGPGPVGGAGGPGPVVGPGGSGPVVGMGGPGPVLGPGGPGPALAAGGLGPPVGHGPVVGPLGSPVGPLVDRAGPPPGLVFHPPGTQVVLGGGVLLSGGTIVIGGGLAGQIATGVLNANRIDDRDWSVLLERADIPKPSGTADPLTDSGGRLDLFRRDTASLGALASLAGGDLTALAALDEAAAANATTGAAAASLQKLASGTFSVSRPVAGAPAAGTADLAAAREVVLAAAAALDRIATVADAPPLPARPIFDLDRGGTALLARLDPETTVALRLRARIDRKVIAPAPPRDELDPIMACPQFLDPMWQGLRDLDADWLLPGLGLVPPDTAALVRTNPPFVAAHMVGLNHELMRELLWREYPTDRRGTGFARFWGRRGAQPDDIRAVHRFAGDLKANLLAGQDPEAVLLLRSELLRRYPGSLVYACRARRQAGLLMLDDDTIVLPAFRGDLPPDVTFVGFPLTPSELRAPGDPWWFVIAQPPSEPRFGLDEPAAGTPAPPATADELAWSRMAAADELAPFAIGDPPKLRGRNIDGVRWGASAAVQARLTYQRPVRVAIRAADLLPASDPPPAGGGGPNP